MLIEATQLLFHAAASRAVMAGRSAGAAWTLVDGVVAKLMEESAFVRSKELR